MKSIKVDFYVYGGTVTGIKIQKMFMVNKLNKNREAIICILCPRLIW